MSGGGTFRAVAADKYDNLYQYDRAETDLGYVNGKEQGTIEAVNVFQIKGKEEVLRAIQFGQQCSLACM